MVISYMKMLIEGRIFGDFYINVFNNFMNCINYDLWFTLDIVNYIV